MWNRIANVILALTFLFAMISCVCLADTEEILLNTPQVAILIIDRVFSNDAYDMQELRFREIGNIPTCRDEFRFALCLLSSENKEYHELGNNILRKYLVSQVRNVDSPYFGSWYYPEYINVTEGFEWDMFIPPTVFQIWFEVRDRLDGDVLELMIESIGYCSKGLVMTWFSDYRSTLLHTNYHLMFVADLLISSEISSNGIGEGFAKIAFDVFVDWSLENGLTEFNSPTYLAVDLQAFYTIENYSTDNAMRNVARNWANFILTDAMIHYVDELSWMSGANSRSYNVLRGAGGTVAEIIRLTRGGLIEDVVRGVGDVSTCYYHHTLPEWMTDIQTKADGDFVFQSRWFDDPWAIRQTWFEKSVIVGSAGRSYGSQDRTVVVDMSRNGMSSCQLVPVISTNDHPWKLPSLGGGFGHNHLNIPVFCDHDGSRLIQLAHIRFKGEVTEEVNRLALTFVTPKEAEIRHIKGKGFAVLMPESKVFIAPFFIIPEEYVIRYQVLTDKFMDSTLVDFELVRFDEGKISIDDIFIGFAMEVTDASDSASLKAWLQESRMTVKNEEDKVLCSFDELFINYSIHNRYPLNLPTVAPDYICFSPFTCVSDGVFYVLDRDIPLRRTCVAE